MGRVSGKRTRRLNGLGTIKYSDGVEWKGEWKDGEEIKWTRYN